MIRKHTTKIIILLVVTVLLLSLSIFKNYFPETFVGTEEEEGESVSSPPKKRFTLLFYLLLVGVVWVVYALFKSMYDHKKK